MKAYKVLITPVNKEEQELWDKYSQKGGNRTSPQIPRPMSKGANPEIKIVLTMGKKPKNCIGKWSPPAKNLEN